LPRALRGRDPGLGLPEPHDRPVPRVERPRRPPVRGPRGRAVAGPGGAPRAAGRARGEAPRVRVHVVPARGDRHRALGGIERAQGGGMRLGPRAKLLLVFAVFAAPIAASILAYRYAHVAPTANHGELLLPPAQVPG